MNLPLDEDSNNARLDEVVAPLAEAARGLSVALIDGDRTLSPDDTSRELLRRAGIDPLPMKRRFQVEGYCFSAFHHHAAAHLELGARSLQQLADAVAADVPLYPGAAAFLHRAAQRAQVFVVSAGVPRIWRSVLDREGLGEIGVIGGIEPHRPFVFGRAEKGRVGSHFRARAAALLAIGDSEVDAEMMLVAHRAVVLVNHRGSEDLWPYLAAHPALSQIAPTGRARPGVPELTFDLAHELLTDLRELRCR